MTRLAGWLAATRGGQGRAGGHFFVRRGYGSAPPDSLAPPRSPFPSRDLLAYLIPRTPSASLPLFVKPQNNHSEKPTQKNTHADEEGTIPSRAQRSNQSVHGCGEGRGRGGARAGAGGRAARRAQDGPALRRLRAQGEEGDQARARCGVDRGGRDGEQDRSRGDGRRGGAQSAPRGQNQEARGDHLRRQRRPRGEEGGQGGRRRREEGGQARELQLQGGGEGEGEEATAGGEETQRGRYTLGDGAAQDPPALRRLRRPHQTTHLQDQRREGCGAGRQCQGRGEGHGHDGHPRHALLPQGEAQPRRGGRGARQRQEGRQGREEGQRRRRRQEQGQRHRGGGGHVHGGRRRVHGGAARAHHVPRGATVRVRGVPAGPAPRQRQLLPLPLLRQWRRRHGLRQPQRPRLLPRRQPPPAAAAAGVPAVPVPLRHGAAAAALQRREPQRLLRHVSVTSGRAHSVDPPPSALTNLISRPPGKKELNMYISPMRIY